MNTRNTTRAQWLALAERYEAVRADDREAREIDAGLAMALGLPPQGYEFKPEPLLWVRRKGRGPVTWSAPRWSRSLDAITALIERELPGIPGDVGIGTLAHGETTYYAVLYVGGDDVSHCGDASTPALALCAAFCRAMAKKADA